MLLMTRPLQGRCTAALGWSELAALPFEDFLREFVRRHPVESLLVLGEADVSPESANAVRHPKSWAYMLFDPSQITDHREFDRAALGCKHLHDVLAGQRTALPLSDGNYERLRSWVDHSLIRDSDVQAWFWALLFNDLGKIRKVVDWHVELGLPGTSDHDRVLADILAAAPERLPGYLALSQEHRDGLLRGLATGFNMGKAAQLECPDAAWSSVLDLRPSDADLHFGHSFFDFLGVTGAIDPQQAKPFILNDNNVEAYLSVAETRNPVTYRHRRAALAGLPEEAPIAVQRLAGMARIFDAAGGARLLSAWQALPAAARAVLEDELGVSGLEGRIAIEPHYGPALLANAAKADPEAGWTRALLDMAEALFEARVLVGNSGEGVAIANMIDLAGSYPAAGIKALDESMPEFDRTVDGGRFRLVKPPVIDAGAFPVIDAGAWLQGKRAAFIGIGGGSDGLQAAQAGLSCGAVPVCVISVRTGRTASDGGAGAVGEVRTIENHGGEIIPGVFRVLPESRGSGRFLENLPADRMRVYLVIDEENGTVGARILAAVADAGGADVLVAVDTGGDSLYSANIGDDTRATPDQDLRVLSAIGAFNGVQTYSLVIAAGVDSPRNAEEVLLSAGAARLDFGASAQDILATYADWRSRVPGAWLGKTPLAWSAALSGQRGLVAIDIPAERVLDRRNPWRPFIRVRDAMASGFFMPVKSHLAALSG